MVNHSFTLVITSDQIIFIIFVSSQLKLDVPLYLLDFRHALPSLHHAGVILLSHENQSQPVQ